MQDYIQDNFSKIYCIRKLVIQNMSPVTVLLTQGKRVKKRHDVFGTILSWIYLSIDFQNNFTKDALLLT